ncbi:hypothetical protein [Aequorivita marisscotiae]|uniref:O-antigen ligase domain-containing protein n=1 Tax=Aequorivita marisscotiae TaxID=3040348 RepID=A0ABY8KWH9_9FLAO|nr:hypothetical protein [Aequorivita sp. Ant34-E75]WGF93437.1 hypothetical protein QCQ61_04405 [Aequorivita sp. Ant34-E75]
MKVFNQIVLIVLFLAIGTKTLSALVAICLVILLASVWIDTKKGKLEVPHYIILVFGLYVFFLVLGIINGHPNLVRDVKFQFFGFVFYLFLVNFKNFNLLRFLFILNAIVSAVYIFIYLGLVPSLWNESIAGMEGRLYGPSIIPIVLIGFYYLYNRMSFDMPLGISWLLALVYLFMTSNLMNLVTAGILLGLIVVNVYKIFKPAFLVGFAIILVGSIAFFNSDFAPEAIKTKLPYILKPWEYASLKTRITDFGMALRAEDFTWSEKLIGEGFGASTTIYRENEIAVSLSGKITFQEIDNGFYYLYHRGGFLLLFLFLLANIYLIYKIPSLKAKLGFIFIVVFTNLLSIHYFNNVFYLIIPFLILETGINKKEEDTKKLEA